MGVPFKRPGTNIVVLETTVYLPDLGMYVRKGVLIRPTEKVSFHETPVVLVIINIKKEGNTIIFLKISVFHIFSQYNNNN